VSATAAVVTTAQMAPSPSAATANSCQEPSEERVELGDPVLWDLDRDLLVVRVRSGI
jgi:hypothetical protein